MNSTTHLSLGILFLCVSCFTSANNTSPITCPAIDTLFATYQVDKTRNSSSIGQAKTIQLLRNADQVALHYPQSEITELWEQTPNQKLHLMRLFDQQQRGIEYQPGEIKGSHDWSSKRQLISDSLIAKMTLENVRGQGCDTVEHYTLTKGDRTLSLEWQPHRKLLQGLREVNGTSTTSWKLISVEENSLLTTQAFDRWNQYQTTDYIDIGDNESDPFLRQMIHLGFVQHGASGFYDADGNSLQQHQH